MNWEKIKEDFDKVISYSQSIPEPKTDKLFELWEINKLPFRRMMGGLIYETEEKVCFEIGEKEKFNRVIEFATTVDFRWHYPELSDFIVSQQKGFFNNLTTEDFTSPEGIEIRKGTKIVKAFKHFVKDERCLTDIQNAASRIIQENKIEGKLCFSIHPLDYLSSSENTHNWRSCHALDGEYRAGNLSYMMDTSTIVCYIKSDEEENLPNFPKDIKWNSKKWRVLIHFSEDKKMIIAGRPYPFDSVAGMELIRDELLKVFDFSRIRPYQKWTDWQTASLDEIKLNDGSVVRLHSHYVPIGGTLKSLHDEIVITPKGSKHFNDILYSSCYIPRYMFLGYEDLLFSDNSAIFTPQTYEKDTKFIIGGFTYCLHCGAAECMSASDTMLCVDCELEYGVSENEVFCRCSCCGRRMLDDDAFWVQDEYVCQSCYDAHVSHCDNCNRATYSADIQYLKEEEAYLCPDCYYDRTLDLKEE